MVFTKFFKITSQISASGYSESHNTPKAILHK